MAISVGTLALEIAVDERKVRTQLRRLDSYAANVARRINNVMGKPATENQVLKNKAALAKTEADTLRSANTRAAIEAKAAGNAAVASINAHASAERSKTRLTMLEMRQRHAMEMAQMRKSSAARTSGGGAGLSMIGLSATVVGAMAFRGLITAINDTQLLRQRLMQVTETQEQARILFDRMAQSAQKLRVPIADATELFVKLRQSNAALGLTYEETLGVTEAFSAALRISGASGQAAASALLQFGQAMAKGRLDGDEFRTVAENASEVLRILEQEFKVSRGEILKWREEGKLTAKMVADTLVKNKEALIDRVNQLPPTLSQAATAFRNSMVQMVGGSKDLERATEQLAQKIIDVGNLLADNGSVLLNFGKWAGILWGVSRAISAINSGLAALGASALFKALFSGGAITGGVLATPFVLGGLGAGLGFALEDLYDAKMLADANKRIREMAQNGAKTKENFQELTNQFVKANAELETAKKDAADLRNISSQDPFRANQLRANAEQITKRWGDAQRKFLELREAIVRAGKERALMLGGGGGGGGGGGDGEDRTKQRIGDLITLLKANYDVFRVTQDLNRELNAQSAIFKNLTLADKDRAQAAQLQDQILKALAERLPDLSKVAEDLGKAIDKSLGETTSAQTEKRLQLLKDNYEELADTITEADRQIILSALARATAELNSLQTKEALTEVQQKYLVKLREEVKLLGELAQRSQQTAGARAQQNAGDPTKTPAQRLGELLDRQLFRQLALAPGQLVADFFAAIGKSIDDGSQSVGAKLRESLGNIFSNVGQNVIQQGFEELMPSFDEMWKIMKKGLGALMKKLGVTTGIFGKLFTKLQALMSDPLFAGPAMIALGAAMVAFGGALGGAATGRDGGGFTGGGIGGLGIGGTTSPVPYVFQGRPYQSPMQGMGGVPEGRNTVNVNATIIGPNDPQAQRQIATLVNNAARRGLVTGPAARTS